MKNICKNCKNWKSEQAELEYSEFSGICTCPNWKFDVQDDDSDVMLLDRKNRSDKYMGVHRFESQSDVVPIGKVNGSRYCLVTDEKFGCINFISK